MTPDLHWLCLVSCDVSAYLHCHNVNARPSRLSCGQLQLHPVLSGLDLDDLPLNFAFCMFCSSLVHYCCLLLPYEKLDEGSYSSAFTFMQTFMTSLTQILEVRLASKAKAPHL